MIVYKEIFTVERSWSHVLNIKLLLQRMELQIYLPKIAYT